MRSAIRWGLYPLLWLWVIGCLAWGLMREDQLQLVLGVKGGAMVALLLFLEWRYPYEARWGMSMQGFLKRDLVFIVVNGATLFLVSTGFAMLAVTAASHTTGPMTGQPVWLQVLVSLFAFEALQYSIHRVMHRADGPLTNVLWRAHAIHHLPQQLYVMMHAVFHPINAVLVRLFVQLMPVWLFGFEPAATFIASSVIAYHGIISHFNVDMRMGWFNYLFIGPELHRYHHSAATHEAKNYGAALSIFDLVFNSFHYRPGLPPADLGLRVSDGYPGQVDPLAALLFPFSLDPVTPGKISSAPAEAGQKLV